MQTTTSVCNCEDGDDKGDGEDDIDDNNDIEDVRVADCV